MAAYFSSRRRKKLTTHPPQGLRRRYHFAMSPFKPFRHPTYTSGEPSGSLPNSDGIRCPGRNLALGVWDAIMRGTCAEFLRLKVLPATPKDRNDSVLGICACLRILLLKINSKYKNIKLEGLVSNHDAPRIFCRIGSQDDQRN